MKNNLNKIKKVELLEGLDENLFKNSVLILEKRIDEMAKYMSTSNIK
jgi:hypothetical protein